MILAGDVGGTKTLLGLFAAGGGRPELVQAASFATTEHAGLEAIVDEFLARAGPGDAVLAASFGVAGPIVEQVAELTNVPWLVDAQAVARRFGWPRVTLLNDLEAMAYSVPVLGPSELATLQEGARVPSGNAGLIAAGTGLGEALLHHVEGRMVPSPTEGGHADFAPRTDEEIALLRFLSGRYGRVDYEHVLSGPGLVNIHAFTHNAPCSACDPASDAAGAPAQISAAAMEGRCPDCARALDLFVGAYGAEAGNLALRSVATAGLFIGGGIAPKILPALRSTRFLDAFRAKAPMSAFMAKIPVAVILNDRAALLGAAVHANRLPIGLDGRAGLG